MIRLEFDYEVAVKLQEQLQEEYNPTVLKLQFTT